MPRWGHQKHNDVEIPFFSKQSRSFLIFTNAALSQFFQKKPKHLLLFTCRGQTAQPAGAAEQQLQFDA